MTTMTKRRRKKTRITPPRRHLLKWRTPRAPQAAVRRRRWSLRMPQSMATRRPPATWGARRPRLYPPCPCPKALPQRRPRQAKRPLPRLRRGTLLWRRSARTSRLRPLGCGASRRAQTMVAHLAASLACSLRGRIKSGSTSSSTPGHKSGSRPGCAVRDCVVLAVASALSSGEPGPGHSQQHGCSLQSARTRALVGIEHLLLMTRASISWLAHLLVTERTRGMVFMSACKLTSTSGRTLPFNWPTLPSIGRPSKDLVVE
mmetsp:Transcript_26639/g.84775  ORF Transcript_26639/g.84775 Transcript_26639/m.84775 type:complete len:259 (+) Transcript_26639:1341-2117(+)